MKLRFALGLLASCAAGALAASALADPPERVGRISYIEGEVSFQPPQESFWTSATRNFPVANGEAFWTGDEGRAELQIGPVAARLDNETELDVVDLDYGSTRLSLAQGSVDLRLWRAPRGGVVVATPAGDVRLDYAGSYRIDVGAPQDDGSYPPIEVTVFEGSAAAPGAEGAVEIDAGEAAMIYAGYDPQAIDVQDAAIDDWARDREQGERWDAYSDQSPGMTGIEDLERYGQFEDTPDYGQVWFPRDVDPDWAPYRYGHWAFVNPWGWTWIDDQPWGFAPFHYGRWAQVDGRWGWIAGRRVSEPVYAPALVAFIGGGDTMGWVALGPDEAYRPDYEVSETYARRLNAAIVNPNALGGVYGGGERRNSAGQFRNAQAAVVVRSNAFARGDPVQRAVVPLAPQALASAPIASPASRPAPTPEARAGVGARGPQGGLGPRAGSITAPPPPTNLEAVRRAVATHPANSFAPPAIPGATVAPPRFGQGAFVAPSQLRHPDAQARQAPPVTRPSTPLTPAPGVSPPRATPLRSLPRAPQTQGIAPQGEGAPLRAPTRPFARPMPFPQSGPNTQEGTPPPRRLERPQPGPQPAPSSQPGPDAQGEMRARAAADAQARRNAAAQAAQQQEQMRLQAERRAAQQRAQGAPPPQAQPPRGPQGEGRTAPPPQNRPPARYRIGPDGKPVPIPPDQNPRQP